MRTFGFSTVVILALAAAGGGCSGSTCEDLGNCAPPAGQDASSDTLAEGAAGADGGTDADASTHDADAMAEASAEADAPHEPVCDTSKSPADEPCLIADAYGVFVSPSGADGASCGAKSSPCKTLGIGLARAKAAGKRVYACGDGGTYAEQVSIDATLDGLRVCGGFKCADWSYDATAVAKVKPSSAGIALHVKGLTSGLLVEDFGFEALDGVNAGDSSVGAIVEGSVGVVLRRVTVQAGAGVKGAEGAAGVKGADGDTAGLGQDGQDAKCPSTTPTAGAWNDYSTCGSKGGKGGPANEGANGYPGLSGLPDALVTPAGVDNSGAGSSTIGENAASGKGGSKGDSGDVGTPAPPAGFFSESGFTPASGGSGLEGNPGQGGGGGGASKAAAGCIGASGGAGGMGGCGGTKGTGGGGGGASVALLSWQSAITLDGCTLLSAKGGDGANGGMGGDGGSGMPGGSGGKPFNTMGFGGPGGPGGMGGPGGSGAGGTGGPSYALVFNADAPVQQGSTVLTPGLGGIKGTGAVVAGAPKAPDGNDGLSAGSYQQN